jgi:membrane-bound lytic murein transglycosylase MltF
MNYTLAYHNTALLYKTYYKRLDVRLAVGFEQRNGWLIRNGNEKLKAAIEKWKAMMRRFGLNRCFSVNTGNEVRILRVDE